MAFRPYLVEEIALDCAEGLLSRREALRRLALLGVSGATAAALLAAVPDSVHAAGASTAPADDAQRRARTSPSPDRRATSSASTRRPTRPTAPCS